MSGSGGIEQEFSRQRALDLVEKLSKAERLVEKDTDDGESLMALANSDISGREGKDAELERHQAPG